MVTYVPDPGDTGAELGALAGTGAGELDADGCTPPGLWDFGSQGPSAGGFAPVYVGVSLWGILEQDDVVDYAIDGDEYSAALIFDFFDGSGVPLCSALFDASESAVPSHDGWVTDSGGTVWEGYAFSLDADAAFTDCAQLDGSLGYQDVRAWAADRSWRIGVGEMTAGLRSSLQSAIDASLGAGTWSGDWDPYVVAQYVDVGGPKAVESGYGMVYSHECYGIDSDGTGSLRPEASLTAGPVDGLLGNAGSWVIMPMAQLP
jgi:hypothetical protein